MKRVLFFACCVLLLALAGCASVNQTNTFVEMPATVTAEAAATPEITQPPVITQPPEIVWLPGEQTDLPPTNTPEVTNAPALDVTNTPAPTITPAPTDMPTQTPAGSPGGLNG